MSKYKYQILGLLITALPVMATDTDITNNKNLLGLRDSEQQYLDRIYQRKLKEKEETNRKFNSTDEQAEIKRLENCQIILKKIDKLSLEILELKDKKRDMWGDEYKLTSAKIKSLELQIERYKIQAREHCESKYFNNSIYLK